jgi:hypothetical protein
MDITAPLEPNTELSADENAPALTVTALPVPEFDKSEYLISNTCPEDAVKQSPVEVALDIDTETLSKTSCVTALLGVDTEEAKAITGAVDDAVC